jgi:type I restriction enzyme S subunit
VFPSNVDKHSYDNERTVLLCNYTDVYYNELITRDLQFMVATASVDQISKFTLLAGDTIITKDSETADDIAISTYVPQDLEGVICGYHLSVVRPREGVCGAFIKRIFDGAYAKAYFEVSANGLTRVGLSQYAIDNLALPVPPHDEQVAVARFLDQETTKIDGLIAEQKRAIDLLNEKRRAVIAKAVTKGLNSSVPMRNSGIALLGEIPAHWGLKRLKHVTIRSDGIQMGPFGGMLKDIETTPTSFKLYGQENTIHDDFTLGSRWLSRELFDSLCEYALHPGDIVLTRKGASIGNCRVVPERIQRGIIDSDTIRVRPDPDIIAAGFVVLLMHEGYMESAILEGQKGAVLPGLNSDTVANLPIAVPPSEEQGAILEFLRVELAKLDALKSEVTRARELLHERRNALISAAVTGKVDVRGLADAEPARVTAA